MPIRIMEMVIKATVTEDQSAPDEKEITSLSEEDLNAIVAKCIEETTPVCVAQVMRQIQNKEER